jgi:hypothetical protein
MFRVFTLLVVCAVVLCAAAADASARRAAACDEDDAPMSIVPDFVRTPLVELRAAPDEPRPPEARVCVAGATDDPSCRPHSSLPPPARSALSLFSETYLLGPAPTLPRADCHRVPLPTEARFTLAPGFVPRLERPPRSFSFVA